MIWPFLTIDLKDPLTCQKLKFNLIYVKIIIITILLIINNLYTKFIIFWFLLIKN